MPEARYYMQTTLNKFYDEIDYEYIDSINFESIDRTVKELKQVKNIKKMMQSCAEAPDTNMIAYQPKIQKESECSDKDNKLLIDLINENEESKLENNNEDTKKYSKFDSNEFYPSAVKSPNKSVSPLRTNLGDKELNYTTTRNDFANHSLA